MYKYHNVRQIYLLNILLGCPDNLEVSKDDLVGEEGKGFSYILDSLNPERILLAAEAYGIAKNALDRAFFGERYEIATWEYAYKQFWDYQTQFNQYIF